MSGNRVKHRVRRGVCALLTAALLAPVWGSALPVGAVTQSEIDALKARQAESQERQAELEEQLTRAEADRDAAREQRQLLGQQLDAINAELESINDQITWYDGEIARKEAERQAAEAREAEQYELFCQRVRTMEEEGTVSYWSVLFNSGSFSELLDRLADVDAVMAYDNRVMDELIAAREELEAVQAQLEEARAAEQAAKEAQEAVKARQQEMLDELNADVAEVNRQLDEEDASWAAIGAEIDRKQKQLEEQRKQNNVQLPPAGNGWMWPLPSANRKLTSAFGFRMHPVDHVPHSHTGIDVAASTGTPIYAARGGQVIMSEYGTGVNWSYGNFVVIDHGDGTTTLYAHMSSRAVSEGELVQQGQTIGAVGTTGNVKGAHLHFEVRINGQRTDPEAYYTGLPLIRAYNW